MTSDNVLTSWQAIARVHPVHTMNADSAQISPLAPTVAIMGTDIKHPAPDLVEPSFVSFDIRAL